MYERSWHRRHKPGEIQDAHIGWWGSLETPEEKQERTFDGLLGENAQAIDELQAWQSYRAASASKAEPSEREQMVGE